VAFEVAPPKYVTIINALQRRIEDGTYPVGGLLPSESTLTREFHVARPTIVRALEHLRQQGWIESRQGRGRFVLGAPATDARRTARHAYAVLDRDETGPVTVLHAATIAAPPRVATILGLAQGAPVVVRRRLVGPHATAHELNTIYTPAGLAAATHLAQPQPLTEGLLTHLRRHTGVDLDHATERIAARRPSPDEARILRMATRDCLLTVLLIVFTRSRRALSAVELLMPAARRSLDQVLPLR
jgi:DNA-binding GntR family transcriptional regulator